MRIMRFHNILFKYRAIGVLLLCVLLAGSLSAQDKKAEKKAKTISISLKVTDENGNAMPKAQVVVGEGIIHAETDENGSFTFKGYPDDYVTVSANGYEKNVVLAEDLVTNGTIKLVKSKIDMS